MFYALSHIEESYLKDNLIKFIALAPCSISTGHYDRKGVPDPEYYEGINFKYEDLGIYNVGGPNWVENKKKGCKEFGLVWCAIASAYEWRGN